MDGSKRLSIPRHVSMQRSRLLAADDQDRWIERQTCAVPDRNAHCRHFFPRFPNHDRLLGVGSAHARVESLHMEDLDFERLKAEPFIMSLKARSLCSSNL